MKDYKFPSLTRKESQTQLEKMHDFCFTIPYGLLLVGGGVFGYFRKGSTASLFGGAGIGLLLTLAGYLSLKAFEKKKNSYPALIFETGSLYFGFRINSALVWIPDVIVML